MKLLPTLTFAVAAFAALHGSAALAADPPSTSTPPIVGMLRLVKADGRTVVSQAIVGAGVSQQIGIRASDAIVAANGRCAFNVRIDEVSQTALAATTTRLVSNDTLVANVTKLDLAAKTLKTFVTQPYLFAGRNMIKVVFNAEAAVPSVAWVAVLVDGTCAATAATPPAPAASSSAAVKPTPPAPVSVQAGSSDWNALFSAYGYSNYAVTGLKGRGYRRYAELLEVNAGFTVAVKAGKIERTTLAALMARWNVITADADFRSAMAKVVPGTDRRV